eukprot:TRINITY_DN55554_c0_g1_i1.p1 TRINITY_DN55554_c0_g1~~TRINITY_DN55554_c0_g1_i1.p1  ORF type:complete len:482 (+),score=152.02 TRINITY_DN55554_c0_g1_i1:103-1446(+)
MAPFTYDFAWELPPQPRARPAPQPLQVQHWQPPLWRHTPHRALQPPSPPPPVGPPSADCLDPRRLFVSQVPAVCDDAQLEQLFLPFGEVTEARVLRDGKGRSKGSALVSYSTEEAAELAIKGLHQQLAIPPHTSPLNVRYAVPQRHQKQADQCSSSRSSGGITPTPPPTSPPSTPSGCGTCGTQTGGSPAPLLCGEAADCLSSPPATASVPSTPPSRSASAQPPPCPAPAAHCPAPLPWCTAKLFIGQLPKTYLVQDVTTLMQEFGEVLEVRILLDSAGQHSGAAFCVFRDEAPAQAAIAALNGRVTLPSMRTPLQVRYPDSPTDGTKLFVGQLPPDAGECMLRRVFEQFGEVAEAAVVLDRDGESRRCAFVRFTTLEAAARATKSLHRRVKLDGATAPLIVKPAASRGSRKPPPAATAASFCSFPYRMPVMPMCFGYGYPSMSAGK